MEIIARLREEREALVARVAQIDKMLQQYDEWGREAQRLLSLTPAVEIGSRDARAAPSDMPVGAESEVPDQPSFRQGGDVRIRVRSASSPVVTGRKTPIPEFEAAVISVLRESGQPMDRVALYDALTARGIVIGDGDRDKELNALSARVYRMAQDPKTRISGERGQGYRLITDEESGEQEGVDDTANDEEDRDPLI